MIQHIASWIDVYYIYFMITGLFDIARSLRFQKCITWRYYASRLELPRHHRSPIWWEIITLFRCAREYMEISDDWHIIIYWEFYAADWATFQETQWGMSVTFEIGYFHFSPAFTDASCTKHTIKTQINLVFWDRILSYTSRICQCHMSPQFHLSPFHWKGCTVMHSRHRQA